MTTDIATIDDNGNYAISKLNALRHGILSRHAILPWEDQGEYEALVQQLEDEYTPQGMTEAHLVEELAGIIWRKARLRGAENAAHMKELCKLVRSSKDDSGYNDTPARVALLEPHRRTIKLKAVITAQPEETAEALALAQEQWNGCKQALAIIFKHDSNAYEQALIALHKDDRDAWPEWIGEPVSNYSTRTYQANAESLESWIRKNMDEYKQDIIELENRQAIKEQAIGQSFPPEDKLEKLSRYETHLDRKFERTLSMLVKLQDMRKTSEHPPAH